MLKTLVRLFSVFFFIGLINSSCKKENFLTGNSLKVESETDSVIFDTVFTQVGSATQRFKIYNKEKEPIIIDEIYLAGVKKTGKSNYRLNINGQSKNSVSNVELGAKDSMYIFVEVTVDPNGTNNPMLVTDSVIVRTGNKELVTRLVAWGQDAYFLYQEVITSDTLWKSDKPIIIIDWAYVDVSNTLSIQPGSRIFMTSGSTLYVGGKLAIKGQHGNEVTFRGDRLDNPYSGFTGGYNGIHFLSGSAGNTIDWVDMRNGTIGIRCDSSIATDVNLSINNSIISNMLYVGIAGLTAKIDCNNLQVTDCGKYTFYAVLGGTYNFKHCTFANNDSTFARKDPGIYLNNSDHPSLLVNTSLNANFTNCIIWGNLTEEINFDFDATAQASNQFKPVFKGCLLKTDLIGSDSLATNKGWISLSTADRNKLNQSPIFTSRKAYTVANNSPAKSNGLAVTDVILQNDLLNKPRTMNSPTSGCYE